jgi:hypothetical protein
MGAAPKNEQDADHDVVFVYNGLAFNAYEVLGLSTGASLDLALKALHEAKQKSEEVSHQFLQTAFDAIRYKG